jgi:hypothetical protein
MSARSTSTDPGGAVTDRSAWLASGLGLAIALVCAVYAVRGLSWPAEIDLYRDLGTSNALLDGNWWGDQAYPGQVRWYPPLLPALIAGISRLTGASTHVVYTRSGPWLNLLGPIFFWLVARRWVGALGAAAALFGLLFFGPQGLDAWKYATYSAWLWPFAFAIGPTFATLWAHPAFARKPDASPVARSALAGALLGVTFLVHPAPAMILALTFATFTVVSSLSDQPADEKRRAWIGLGITAAVSAALVLPYIVPLFRTYHLHMVNIDPARKVGVSLHEMFRELVTPRMAVAVIGLVGLARSGAWRVWRAWPPATVGSANEGRGPAARLLFAFAVATLLLFGYGLVAQALENFHILLLPMFVPTLHFHLYVNTLELLGFGAGFVTLIRALAPRIGRVVQARVSQGQLAVGMLVALAVVVLPRHLHSRDLSHYRQASLGFAADPALHDLYGWLRDHTAPDAVVLCHEGLAGYTVGAAGRGVVRMPMNHSNPYVSFAQREADNDRMYRALREGDGLLFRNLAAQYRVSYVALEDEAPATSIAWMLRPIGRFGRVDLLQVQLPQNRPMTTAMTQLQPAADGKQERR